MKNKLTIVLSLFLVLFVAVGCGLGGLVGGGDKSSKGSDEKSTTSESSKNTEAKPSGEVVKVGIEECDELATFINDNSEEIEGSLIARGIVYVYKNMVLEKIKEGVKDMDDKQKEQYAKACTKSLVQLRKSMKK